MFGVFERSWHLTKLSFSVIKQDKEMLLFPLLGGVFSIAYAGALLFPTVILDLMNSQGESITLGALQYVALFVTYLGLSFIATFFNVCVVYTTKTRFEGGDATFGDSFKFAISRIPQIFVWALVAATVGVLLRALDNAAERAGGIGRIILGIVVSLLGLMWSIVTLFVVPAMVYENVGPIDALKSSVETIKRTWGESLVRHYGLGLMQFLFGLLGIAIAVGLFAATKFLGMTGVIIAVAFCVIYFVGLGLVFSVANGVFNTALYTYAKTGMVPTAWDEGTLQSAFVVRD